MEKNTRCPACGQSMEKIGTLPVRDFDGSIFNFTSRIHECCHCGFARMETGLSDGVIADHYANASLYSSLSGVGVGGCTPDDLVRYRHYTTFVGDEAFCCGRFADIGCSRGGFLRYLTECYPDLDVTGVDCDRKSLDLLAASGLKAMVGNAFDLPFEAGAKDMLSYFHVLEHVYDVDALLREAGRVLAPGGSLLIEVPDAANYSDPACRVGTMFWIAMKEHVNHFALPSLYRYCERNGFGVLATSRSRMPMKSGATYPSLMLLAKKGESSKPLPQPAGMSFRKHLLNESEALRKQIDGLKAFSAKHDCLTFWGIGLEFLNLCAHSQRNLQNTEIRLVDANPAKQGLAVDGIAVQMPNAPPVQGGLVCCSYMSRREIVAAASRLGWEAENIFTLDT